LRGVFEACFLVKAPAGALGALRAGVVKDAELKYHVHLPKAYKADKPWRTVIVLPGSATAGSPGWVDGPAYFAATWDKAALTADTIFHLPGIPGTVELDPVPDYSREGADEEESKRIQAVFGTFREVMLASNVDRSRVFADFGRDACGFGLRFMTLFPDRWAGAVLRAPVAVDDIRLGTLTGIPILLLRTAGTAAVVDGLKERLEAVSPGAVTVLEATDEYPHKAATPQIEEWMGKQRRSMTPKRVVVEPNHNRFNRAYWVDIDTADSLLTVAPDKKPRIEAVADRAANRITVKTVGVESFTLFLNDDLVDLDQEFTVVVNDKAQTEKRTRSFRELRDQVISRNDWDCLYPVKLSTSVSKQ
jgi:hypothetical protein